MQTKNGIELFEQILAERYQALVGGEEACLMIVIAELGDREECRIVVYDGSGKFIKTIQMRNLVCALYVDPHGHLGMATGQEGQIFKIDWDGNVLGPIGNGPGRCEGQFIESNYMAMDSHGNPFYRRRNER